ncbi:molybdenum cofactor biosynthesis protein MoaE [Frigoribacterium sp. PhB24]|uniref:molybdenum cofactor biosynthesis protein MoaE n=1 Tax=Frigoribacterium sp. PhB24 TaxID=2485204 RepID=UPI000F4A3DBA|nr:molybdenum cofactor biosynthesis protein MoaE [Frigoribacterium sp. PhB24]ROS51466.1 molybdopterin synthase subunit MoaE [Frigoribacterium sp. PhB24]
MTDDDPTLLPGGGHDPAPATAGGTAPAADRVLLARVVDVTVSVAECSALVTSRASGAVVTFEGVVRDHDEGRGVEALHYEAHPTATEVIREVALAVAEAHPEVAIAVEHRYGDLVVGDVALACAVASAHRAEAFAACAALVDEVKARTPIWKRQEFTDGSDEWVASLG